MLTSSQHQSSQLGYQEQAQTGIQGLTALTHNFWKSRPPDRGKNHSSGGEDTGKLVTEKPVAFVGFDNVAKFNQTRQNDDDVVKAYKSYFS